MHFPGFKILGVQTDAHATLQTVSLWVPLQTVSLWVPITEEPIKYRRMSHVVAASTVFYGCTRPAFGACIKYFKF